MWLDTGIINLVVMVAMCVPCLTTATLCYSCNSLEDANCLDPLVEGSVQTCTGNYCIKTKGEILAGKLTTYRSTYKL